LTLCDVVSGAADNESMIVDYERAARMRRSGWSIDYEDADGGQSFLH
jgi:hypothetical protein